MDIVEQISDWIDKTNERYASQRQSCLAFADDFDGYYTAEFLSEAYFVVVDEIPKPEFIGEGGGVLAGFVDMDVCGITYKDTYYVHNRCRGDSQLHFHELVHVAQWKILGVRGFLSRYIAELEEYGYDKAPLEWMAYSMDSRFAKNEGEFDVQSVVGQYLG